MGQDKPGPDRPPTEYPSTSVAEAFATKRPWSLLRRTSRSSKLDDEHGSNKLLHDVVVQELVANPDVPNVSLGDRYVVVYALSFDHDIEPSPSGENISSPRDAAHFALEFTRDAGASDCIWRVYDTVTKKWTTFAQEEIE